jgi:hypothetical protein
MRASFAQIDHGCYRSGGRILNFIVLMTAVEMKLEFWILFFLISVTEMECKFLILC